MIPTERSRATRASIVVAWLATLALALAACSSTNPPSPFAAAGGSAGVGVIATQAPTATQFPTATQQPAATATARPATSSPGPVVTLPPPAHKAQTIHVLELPGQFTFAHVGAFTGCTSAACQGDTMIGRSQMLDAATHKVIGAFLANCVLVDPSQKLYQCPANVITLTGRGQIVFTETLLWGGGGPGQDNWATWTPWPIIGGTGEFFGARGTIDSPADSTWTAGDFVITITG
jgi:hypothetical protein